MDHPEAVATLLGALPGGDGLLNVGEDSDGRLYVDGQGALVRIEGA